LTLRHSSSSAYKSIESIERSHKVATETKSGGRENLQILAFKQPAKRLPRPIGEVFVRNHGPTRTEKSADEGIPVEGRDGEETSRCE
jgi:hypothetical protein